MKNQHRHLWLLLIIVITFCGCGGGRSSQLDTTTPSYIALLQPDLVRWSNFPIHVSIDDSNLPPLSKATNIGFVKEAFADWAQGAPQISVEYVDSSDPTPKVSISWENYLAVSDGSANIGGLTTPEIEGNTLLGMRIRLALGTPSGFMFTNLQLRRSALHEIGHSLGIVSHSPNPADLMYAIPTATNPTSRDFATIIELYNSAPTITDPLRIMH